MRRSRVWRTISVGVRGLDLKSPFIFSDFEWVKLTGDPAVAVVVVAVAAAASAAAAAAGFESLCTTSLEEALSAADAAGLETQVPMLPLSRNLLLPRSVLSSPNRSDPSLCLCLVWHLWIWGWHAFYFLLIIFREIRRLCWVLHQRLVVTPYCN